MSPYIAGRAAGTPDPSRAEPRRRRPFVVGVEALLIVLMLPFGLVFTGTLWIHQFQLVVLAVGGAIGWAWTLWRPTDLQRPLVVAPLPLLAAGVITAVTSGHPSLSWSAVWQTIAYAGIFWLLARQASRPAGRRDLLMVISTVLILTLGSYLLAVALAWREWLALGFPLTSLPLRPLGTGGLALIPTWLADLVAVTAPVVVATLWSRGARWPAGALAAVALGAILVSGTRSVLVIVAAVSVLTALLALRARAGRQIVAVIAAAAIAIGIVGSVVALSSPRSFDEGRSSAYASAISRFAASPVVGSGPGTYGVNRMGDPVEDLGLLAFPDAHNVMLNTAAESGLVGLAGGLLTVGLLALAVRRSWLASPGDRLIIAGALFGAAIFAGHSMVDVVFALVGIVVLAIGVIALAATSDATQAAAPVSSSRSLRAGLGAALLGVLLISTMVVRTELSFVTIAAADELVSTEPATALTLARRATAANPDSVPAWWMQMAAADSAGDLVTATAAAHEITELEGFGQEWLSLAVLASRAGDHSLEHDAIASAIAGPPLDPLVELNVAILLDAAGDHEGALAAARRLLKVQPDIERVVIDGPPALASIVASVRAATAAELLDEANPNAAFLIALTAEDRALADTLLARLGPIDPAAVIDWPVLVDAWFGNEQARSALDGAASMDPAVDRLSWAWRVAVHACDTPEAERWSRAMAIAFDLQPATPTGLGVTPDFRVRLLPAGYPPFVWRIEYPQLPYVSGTWVFGLGRPPCGATTGG